MLVPFVSPFSFKVNLKGSVMAHDPVAHNIEVPSTTQVGEIIETASYYAMPRIIPAKKIKRGEGRKVLPFIWKRKWMKKSAQTIAPLALKRWSSCADDFPPLCITIGIDETAQ